MKVQDKIRIGFAGFFFGFAIYGMSVDEGGWFFVPVGLLMGLCALSNFGKEDW